MKGWKYVLCAISYVGSNLMQIFVQMHALVQPQFQTKLGHFVKNWLIDFLILFHINPNENSTIFWSFKQVGTGGTKDLESWGTLKNIRLEYSTGEKVLTGDIIIYRMRCETLRGQIVRQFKNQRLSTWNCKGFVEFHPRQPIISSRRVFRESTRKGQGSKPFIECCSHQIQNEHVFFLKHDKMYQVEH